MAITLVLFLGVAAYMGYYIFGAFSDRISVAEAVSASAEDTISINGWFARDEYTVSLAGGADEIVVSEGEKVSKGLVCAVSYVDGSAAGLSHSLDLLERRLDQLEGAAVLTPGEEIQKVDAEVGSSLCNLSYAAATGSFSKIDSSIDALKRAVYRRDYVHGRIETELLSEEIANIQETIDVYSRRAGQTSASLRAPTSGYFSAAVDGYEQILTYDGILEMTPDDIDALANLRREDVSECCGKISTSFGWRFAAVVSEKQARQLERDKWYTLRFSDDYVGEVYCRLYQIGEAVDGRCTVVFSGASNIGELLSLRRQNAEIILRSYEGIRVPKSAIRLNENGENGVYILLAAQARFVRVEQIYEADNYYIVAYEPGASSALRPGDEIIVRSTELYNGKVVE